MPLRTLYDGPQYPSLEAAAFSKLADLPEPTSRACSTSLETTTPSIRRRAGGVATAHRVPWRSTASTASSFRGLLPLDGRLGGPNRRDVLGDVVDPDDVGAAFGRQRRRRHRRREPLARVLAAN